MYVLKCIKVGLHEPLTTHVDVRGWSWMLVLTFHFPWERVSCLVLPIPGRLACEIPGILLSLLHLTVGWLGSQICSSLPYLALHSFWGMETRALTSVWHMWYPPSHLTSSVYSLLKLQYQSWCGKYFYHHASGFSFSEQFWCPDGELSLCFPWALLTLLLIAVRWAVATEDLWLGQLFSEILELWH